MDIWKSIKSAAIYLMVAAVIFTLFGWMLHAQCNPPPVITPGEPDTNLTIKLPKPDTSRPQPIISIKPRPRPPATQPQHDSTLDTSRAHGPAEGPRIEDSSVCWEFKDTTAQKAIISMEICSSELPRKKPVDLSTWMVLALPPDTMAEIFRMDTVHVSTPAYKDWKVYTILLLILTTAGAATGHIHF
jgi:hypothetical protein